MMVGRRINGGMQSETSPTSSTCTSYDCSAEDAESFGGTDNKSRNGNSSSGGCWRTNLVKLFHLVKSLSICQQTVLALVFFLVLPYIIHRGIVYRNISKEWVLSPIMHLERPCPSPSYPLLISTPEGRQAASQLKICLTTLTDEKTKDSVSWIRRKIRWRNYDNILELTWASKQAYAEKHGYHLFDGSHWVQKGRPAQWSKIIAVQQLMKEENCDWVLWHDADTLFANTNKKIEDLLPADSEMSLLVAIDTPNPGYNSGSWLIKNSEWGREFLQRWWDMKSYVRLPGQSLSGDNDAFKVLLASYEESDFKAHVGVPPRCSINAFAKFLRPWQKESMTEEKLKSQPWYMSEDYYHKGDFIVHVPGIDNKRGVLEMMLKEVQ